MPLPESLLSLLALLDEAREKAEGANDPDVEIISPIAEARGMVLVLSQQFAEDEEPDRLAIRMAKDTERARDWVASGKTPTPAAPEPKKP